MSDSRNLGRLRRPLWKRLAGWAGGLTASGGLLDSMLPDPRWIVVTRPVARIRGLPAAWEGARIALLADLHAGPLCGLSYLRKAIAMANAASPDLVVLVGDCVSLPEAITPALTALLAELRAPDGKFAVLGNHDWYCGGRRVEAALREAGIDVLVNAHRVLRRDGQAICLVGVDDWGAGDPDLAAAMDGADGVAPRLLLTHNPDLLEDLPPDVRVDFALCGHTHGGQIRLPFGWLPYVPVRHRKYLAGAVAGPRCPGYVSRGIGMVCVPVRLRCRPELPIITLTRSERPIASPPSEGTPGEGAPHGARLPQGELAERSPHRYGEV